MAAYYTKQQIKEKLYEEIKLLYRKRQEEATAEQIYYALAELVRQLIMDDWLKTHELLEKKDPKKLYYLSMEFLMGRALGNQLINLEKYGEFSAFLADLGIDLRTIEEEERDPALGNGGLGRLAACFLDSLATGAYPAYGCGIRYKYGLFRQKIMNGYQVEVPDNWLKNGYPFEIRRSEYTCEVKFNGYVETLWDGERNYFELRNYQVVKAVPYDLPILGYGNHFVDTLEIWDAEPVEEFSLGEFDRGNYMKAVEQAYLAETISNVLYPNDLHIEGKELRLRQQYFFVSASVQTAVRRYLEKHTDIRNLWKKTVFHMNDTHPTLCIPELMRILLDEFHLRWEEAWEITSRSCAFTNHTILSEALETWPCELMVTLLPRVFQIIQEMDRRLKYEIRINYPGREDLIRDTAIISGNTVRMANMAIYGSFSINGVAKIHTEILKRSTFRAFYELYPEKFSNKTNGVTQRRFLLKANPLLAQWITEKIGNQWITDLPRMEKLIPFCSDPVCQEEFLSIKKRNKERLRDYILEHNGIKVDTDSIFDVHVKRLHEYKRQLMNILHIMLLYHRLKTDPSFDMVPHTYIFGAKAAPGYLRAKLIIKLINSVAEVINSDPEIFGKIKVVFLEDYSVSIAELVFPAADISEQISTASKEASGTSNMKFMMNGAITLGTMDGANIEIVEKVGPENAFIFGMSAEEVMEHETLRDYNPMEIFRSDPEIREVLLELINGTFSPDEPELFREIYSSLLYPVGYTQADPYFILKDFRDYLRAHEEAERRYLDRNAWAYSAMMNTAGCGKFSSDRTVQEYADEIWHLEKTDLEEMKDDEN